MIASTRVLVVSGVYLAWVVLEHIWMVSRGGALVGGEIDRGSSIVLGVLYGVGLAGAAAAAWSGGAPIAPPSVALAIGAVLFAIPVVFRPLCMIYLGKSFTPDLQVHEGHHVVDTGPYRLVRHPLYAAALVTYLALVMAFDSWYSLAPALVFPVAGVLYRITIEERMLVRRFGDAYASYIKRTKRLIPFIY